MNQLDSSPTVSHRRLDENELQDVIRLLEARIQELDAGGESAYEKALVRSYEMTLSNYRTRLADLKIS